MFCIIIFYEHFLDDERQTRLSRYATFGLGVGLVTFFLTASMLVNAPQTLRAEYSYLILGVVSCMPLGLLLFSKPALVRKVIWLGGFFFVLNLIFEITALHLNQYSYPGTYVGMIKIIGANFPLEELIFWIVKAILQEITQSVLGTITGHCFN